MLEIADNPNEGDTTGSDGAEGEFRQELVHVGNLVRDSRGPGDEDAVPVGGEGVVAGVGTLEGGGGTEAARGCGEGAGVEGARHAGVGRDEERYGGA